MDKKKGMMSRGCTIADSATT
uniref:Uncharacterized protein n=1 Tax=Arundo donax TaxID=35708 RepID=A0A0A9EIR3_ARUDO